MQKRRPPATTPTKSAARIAFMEPMYATAVRTLPDGPDWIYEIKLDGYRCLAGNDATGVKLWSRRSNLLTSQFPTIASACKLLPPGTLVDGEIVALDENGRISFNTLQHHRSRASAIHFYAFDLLLRSGRSMLERPLQKRRDALTDTARLQGFVCSPAVTNGCDHRFRYDSGCWRARP